MIISVECGAKECRCQLPCSAVQGAINSAWMMKKSELLIAEFDHLRQVAKEVYTEKNFYDKLRSIDCNLDKLKLNMFFLTSDYNRLTSESSYSDRIKVGNDVHRGLEAIKKLHEALRKGMERLRKYLFKATIKDSVDSTANYISSEVTGEEMVSLAWASEGTKHLSGKRINNEGGVTPSRPARGYGGAL